MATASDVAKYILTLSQPEEGDYVSNLKLQKLLYYAQGFHLALRGRPLFQDSIQAWPHGPVVPGVYHIYKDNGSSAIPIPMDFSRERLTSEERDLLDEVWSVYGQFSAWKLRDMTHEEPPWKNTPSGGEIAHSALQEFFSTQVLEPL